MNKKDELFVTIRREGNAIFAICGDKTAKAVCSPDDEFDYITGAKLAFERLIAPKFKVGDKIIGNDLANRYGFTKRGSEGIVVGYSDPFSHIVKVDFDTRTFAVRDKLGYDYAKENYIAKGWSVIDDCFDLAAESSKAPKTEARFDKHEFRVGDTVKVVDTGACCSRYYAWVVENITEKAQIARFAYGNGMGYPATRSLNQPFIILFEKYGMAYISEDDKHKPCYVIAKRGLEHYPTR